MTTTAYEGWALVEQMGFRKTVGRVAEVEMYGTKMLRLDIPTLGGGTVTRFCGGPSLYQVSPLEEDVALEMVKRQSDPRPVKPTTFRIEGPRREDDDYMGSTDGASHDDDDTADTA